MAQVSGSTSSIQQAIGALQSRNPRQNQQVSPDAGKTVENDRSNRLEKRKENNAAQQVRQTEDRVLISRGTQEPNRGPRVDEGKRNVDNLRPSAEQRANERGPAQRLNDLSKVNRFEARNAGERIDRTQPQNTTGTNDQKVNAERNRTESRKEAETQDQIRKEAADRKNPEVQLREFQNKDEIRIEPKKVSKSVKEVAFKREQEKAARETVFETPSQRIIQKATPSATEPSRSAENNVRNDRTGNNQQPKSPASVQTETGQNIDNLI